MAGQEVPWLTRLKAAHEKCVHDGDPDLFAALIELALQGGGGVDALAKYAGLSHDEEKAWIHGWAKGAIVPTPTTRRRIIAGLRARFEGGA
jgi:hypothetical protein